MAKYAKLNNDEDLISSLPDEIITHILSYIPTKSAVATSVLSKRWNDLWISVPNLDFTCNLPSARYEKFVDRVLTLNNALSVRAIRLRDHYVNPGTYCVNSWISSIAKRDAEVIDIKIITSPIYRLPDSFFIKTRLVNLKLKTWLCKIPQLVRFPNLKTIHLEYVCFDDDGSMQNLLSGCPVLENLYIEFSDFRNAHTFDIRSSTLHVLRLRSNCHTGSKFVVDTPNVRDLHLVGWLRASCDMINLSSLMKLHLRFDGWFALMSCERLINMPIFHNLIHLTFHVTEKEQWVCLPRLLHRAPNLVTFVILSLRYHDSVPCVWYDPHEVPYCLLSSIESIEIPINFYKGSQEVMMISYFLKNANVLKRLSFIHNGYAKPEEDREFVNTLLTLPRSSIACQVHYKGVVI